MLYECESIRWLIELSPSLKWGAHLHYQRIMCLDHLLVVNTLHLAPVIKISFSDKYFNDYLCWAEFPNFVM